MDKKLSEYLAKIGSKGGKKAAQSLTKAERIKRAKKAAMARHHKEDK